MLMGASQQNYSFKQLEVSFLLYCCLGSTTLLAFEKDDLLHMHFDYWLSREITLLKHFSVQTQFH